MTTAICMYPPEAPGVATKDWVPPTGDVEGSIAKVVTISGCHSNIYVVFPGYKGMSSLQHLLQPFVQTVELMKYQKKLFNTYRRCNTDTLQYCILFLCTPFMIEYWKLSLLTIILRYTSLTTGLGLPRKKWTSAMVGRVSTVLHVHPSSASRSSNVLMGCVLPGTVRWEMREPR